MRSRGFANTELVVLALGVSVLCVGLSPVYRMAKAASQARRCEHARQLLAEAQRRFYHRTEPHRFATTSSELRPYLQVPVRCPGEGSFAVRLASHLERDAQGLQMHAGDLVLRCTEPAHRPVLLMQGHPDPRTALTP